MFELVKKFWEELNKIRYIEISYGTEENNKKTQELDFTIDPDSRKLNKDLNKRIVEIQIKKREGLIEYLSCLHTEKELKSSGLILTQKERRKRAEAELRTAIITGKLDYFYNFVS